MKTRYFLSLIPWGILCVAYLINPGYFNQLFERYPPFVIRDVLPVGTAGAGLIGIWFLWGFGSLFVVDKKQYRPLILTVNMFITLSLLLPSATLTALAIKYYPYLVYGGAIIIIIITIFTLAIAIALLYIFVAGAKKTHSLLLFTCLGLMYLNAIWLFLFAGLLIVYKTFMVGLDY